MRTVSCNTARLLKDAGLEWKPSWSDHFTDESGLVFNLPDDYIVGNKDEFTWLPTLSDLLEWLEGRGYEWTMYTTEYSDDGINYKHGYVFQLEQTRLTEPFVADITEDAAAKAVIWVLEQEAK